MLSLIQRAGIAITGATAAVAGAGKSEAHASTPTEAQNPLGSLVTKAPVRPGVNPHLPPRANEHLEGLGAPDIDARQVRFLQPKAPDSELTVEKAKANLDAALNAKFDARAVDQVVNAFYAAGENRVLAQKAMQKAEADLAPWTPRLPGVTNAQIKPFQDAQQEASKNLGLANMAFDEADAALLKPKNKAARETIAKLNAAIVQAESAHLKAVIDTDIRGIKITLPTAVPRDKVISKADAQANFASVQAAKLELQGLGKDGSPLPTQNMTQKFLVARSNAILAAEAAETVQDAAQGAQNKAKGAAKPRADYDVAQAVRATNKARAVVAEMNRFLEKPEVSGLRDLVIKVEAAEVRTLADLSRAK